MTHGSARGPEARWKRIGIVSWSAIGVLILVAVALYVLGRISTAVTPMVIAFILVLMLKNPVAWLQRKGMHRTLAVTVAYLVALVGLVVAGLFIVPPLVAQIRRFVIDFPKYYESAVRLWADLQARYDALTLAPWMQEALDSARTGISARLVQWSQSAAEGVFAAGSGIVTFVITMVLAVVVAFYVLKDLPAIREGVIGLIREEHRDEARRLYVKVIRTLGGYLRGQLIVATFVGILSWVGLAVIGVPYALVIGLICGVFNIIPYLGPVVGGAVAVVAALFEDPILALWAALWLFVVQQVESAFFQPRIMSDQVDLHPVLVIFSLLVGASLMGFAGMLIAIPVAAVAKGVFVFYMENHGDGARPVGGGAAGPHESSESEEDPA